MLVLGGSNCCGLAFRGCKISMGSRQKCEPFTNEMFPVFRIRSAVGQKHLSGRGVYGQVKLQIWDPLIGNFTTVRDSVAHQKNATGFSTYYM